jgi:hypothetical protein
LSGVLTTDPLKKLNLSLAHMSKREDTYGTSGILLQQADDLSHDTSWHQQGFCTDRFLPEREYLRFMKNCRELFQHFLEKAGITIDANSDLSEYHRWVGNDDQLHLRVVEQAKLLSVVDFPVSPEKVVNRVSEICRKPLRAFNPWDQAEVFHFRIIRPLSHDNNPLHRDVWLEDYDDCINIYVPICGSNERSSLTLIPGSHLWPEEATERTPGGALVHGVQFHVPTVTASKKPLNPIRPNPGRNELLVFSPYLLHGGANNLNKDLTRISLEMRFWRKPNT